MSEIEIILTSLLITLFIGYLVIYIVRFYRRNAFNESTGKNYYGRTMKEEYGDD